MIRDCQKLLRFSEFAAAKKSEEIAEGNSKTLTDALPVMLTFQRKLVLRFSDGTVVGKYREVRTGIEIVFPIQFSH